MLLPEAPIPGMLSILVKKSFAQLLAAAREQRGMTQADLSRASGFNTSRISKLERGDSIPRLETLLTLSRALKMTIGELIDGLDEDDLITEHQRKRGRAKKAEKGKNAETAKKAKGVTVRGQS
jgi:transcriptional regulator with XRE-family HTH domain